MRKPHTVEGDHPTATSPSPLRNSPPAGGLSSSRPGPVVDGERPGPGGVLVEADSGADFTNGKEGGQGKGTTHTVISTAQKIKSFGLNLCMKWDNTRGCMHRAYKREALVVCSSPCVVLGAS